LPQLRVQVASTIAERILRHLGAYYIAPYGFSRIDLAIDSAESITTSSNVAAIVDSATRTGDREEDRRRWSLNRRGSFAPFAGVDKNPRSDPINTGDLDSRFDLILATRDHRSILQQQAAIFKRPKLARGTRRRSINYCRRD